MTKPDYTYLRLNKAKPGSCNIMRVTGDYEYLFQILDLTIITESEFWAIARNDPDFVQYLNWKDEQRQPQWGKIKSIEVVLQPRLI